MVNNFNGGKGNFSGLVRGTCIMHSTGSEDDSPKSNALKPLMARMEKLTRM